MTDVSILEMRINEQARNIQKLEDRLAKLLEDVHEAESARRAQERNMLLAGITFLGGVIFTLIGVIWKYIVPVMKG